LGNKGMGAVERGIGVEEMEFVDRKMEIDHRD
jgi:hypothetical protein